MRRDASYAAGRPQRSVSAPLLDDIRLQRPPADTPSAAGHMPIPARWAQPCRRVRARGPRRESPGGRDRGRPSCASRPRPARGDGRALAPSAAGRRALERARRVACEQPQAGGGRFLVHRLASAPPRSGGDDIAALEHGIGVDQTNVSVVVDDAVIVKWLQRPEAGGQRAAMLLAHLAAVGDQDVPRPVWIARLARTGWPRGDDRAGRGVSGRTPGMAGIGASLDSRLTSATTTAPARRAATRGSAARSGGSSPACMWRSRRRRRSSRSRRHAPPRRRSTPGEPPRRQHWTEAVRPQDTERGRRVWAPSPARSATSS